MKVVYVPLTAAAGVSAVMSGQESLLVYVAGFLVLVVFLYLFGLGLTYHALWLPLILFTQLIFSLGLTFLLSTITTFYRDVVMMLDVVLQAWFFLSPVFYSFETLFGESASFLGVTFNPAQIMRWVNPMASIIDAYRTVLWGTVGSDGPVAMHLPFLLRTLVTSILVLVISYVIFVRAEHKFGEKL